MNYTEKQKNLLLDRLFDGDVCLDIYNNRINIIHYNYYLSHYNFNGYEFWLNWYQIWVFFENKNKDTYQEIEDLSEAILRDLTKQKELTTFASFAINS